MKKQKEFLPVCSKMKVKNVCGRSINVSGFPIQADEIFETELINEIGILLQNNYLEQVK